MSMTTLEGSPQADRPSGAQTTVVLALVMAKVVELADRLRRLWAA